MYKLYHGAQDEYFSNLLPYKFVPVEDSEITTETCFIIIKETCSKISSDFIIGSPDDYENDIGYTNIRILCDSPNELQSVSLCIHYDGLFMNLLGSYVTRIYPYTNGQLHFSLTDKDIIPSFKTKKYYLRVIYNNPTPIHIEYDKVKMANKLKDNEVAEILYSEIQYCGEDIAKVGENRIRINFNHPLKIITINGTDILNKVKNIKILLDNNIKDKTDKDYKTIYTLFPSKTLSSTDKVVFAFEKPINFTMINKPLLCFDNITDKEFEIHVLAEDQNVAIFHPDNFEVRFRS